MKTKLFEITCPNCHQTYYVNAETLINAELEPNYHDMLLDQSFFNRKCSNCDYIITIKYPFIYYDPKAKIQLRYNLSIDGDNQVYVSELTQLIEYIKILDDELNIFEILEIKQMLNDQYPDNAYDGCDENNYYFMANQNTILIKRH